MRNPSEISVIREEQDGLRIFLDLQKLDKERAAQALKSILSQLERCADIRPRWLSRKHLMLLRGSRLPHYCA